MISLNEGDILIQKISLETGDTFIAWDKDNAGGMLGTSYRDAFEKLMAMREKHE